MKKFLNHRVLPFVCALSILISLCVVPVGASWDTSRDVEDFDAVYDLEAKLRVPSGFEALGEIFDIRFSGSVADLFWEFVDNVVLGGPLGEVGVDELSSVASAYSAYFNRPVQDTFYKQLVSGGQDIATNVLSFVLFGKMGLTFELRSCGTSGMTRIYCPELDAWIVSSTGRYAYVNEAHVDTSGGNQWIGETTAADRAKKEVAIHSLDRLTMMCNTLRENGIPAQIKSLGSNFKCIWYNRMVYADSEGIPFLSWVDSKQSATEQERPPTTVTENGDVIEGDLTDNSVNIDMEGMTITLPDGSINFIDKIIYDESTKSYHIDSHDTYNYTTYNYYTWNYYINYTSITYIGQTEEYNKYYEVYYELPDGRDSADLTKEDLEQLNLSIDVIPYGRSADDTSLRSLYHFDGDTKDSSYWNYCTDFTWNRGASLTYMDAGVFDGALYLDENEHDFTLTLPSNILADDFTFQFRYYQSATPAPVSDSALYFGSSVLARFNGSSILTGGNGEMAVIPVGTWNEICVSRESGIYRYYLNGVQIRSGSLTTSFGNTIRFVFGNQQQTYKYIDEMRFVNKAVYGSASTYECSAVPFDTNLTLVLPDSQIPIADEYWQITSSKENLLSANGMDTWIGETLPSFTVSGGTPTTASGGYWHNVFNNWNWGVFPVFGYNSTITDVRSYSDRMSIVSKTYVDTNGVTMPLYTAQSTGNVDYRSPTYGLHMRVASCTSSNITQQASGTYTFSMVDCSGNVGSFVFTIPSEVSFTTRVQTLASTEFNGYLFALYGSRINSNYVIYSLSIQPTAYDIENPFIYLELVSGNGTDLNAEKISSVTIMDKADLNTPTLAVRTDIDITSYQIGGARPSLPTKGQVWAMVESDRIVSIQIYNGQAWEGVDGRIWTGQRWIPASSYNIITLQDMYDIVDATPNYEYIYSEAGFWAWWQKSWNAFTEKLFATLGSGTGSGSGGATLNPDTAPAVPDDETTGEKGYSIIDLFVVLKDGTWSFITGIVSTAYDGFNGFVESVSSAGSFFEFYDDESEESIFFIPLEEGETIWD